MPANCKNKDSHTAGGVPLAALAVALLAESCLQSSAAYATRSGAAAVLFTVPVLALVCCGFFLCWRFMDSPLVRVLWGIILFFSSAREILRISFFLQKAYPGTIPPILCGLLLLLPAVYLRQSNVVGQVGRVLLWMLVAGGLLLVGSVLPHLRFEHLQMQKLTPSLLSQAGTAQLTLYPEYFLPVLWLPRNEEKHASVVPAWRLPLLGVGINLAVHFLLELFFGAASLARDRPLYTAACSGAFSVFTRLEWIQLFLWCGAAGLRMALYFCATIRLLRGPGKIPEADEVPLPFLPCYGGGLLFFCLLFSDGAEVLGGLCNGGMWVVAALTMIGGAAAWLCQKAGSSC